MTNSAQDIHSEVARLAKFWAPRQSALMKWYDLIRLTDNLAQDKMESVISSDPRTGFNMAKWLLTPDVSRFSADVSGLTDNQQLQVGTVEKYADLQLSVINRRNRTSLYGTFTDRFIGLMLATGWYCFISIPTQKSWVMSAWNPAQVFPEYDEEGHLIRVGRSYTLTKRQAMIKIKANGWIVPSTSLPETNHTVDNLWFMTSQGAAHAVAIGPHLAKPPTLASPPMPFIPIYTGPVAGLPDDGSIMKGDLWKADIGGSIVAPIADIQHNYNKMLTYFQQLLRDTANPKYIEKVRGTSVIDKERLFERGAVFSMDPEEDMYPLQPPGLPPEIRGHNFDLRNQLQRGLFSDVTFGNIVGQISGYLVSQVVSSSKQTLNPYYQAILNALGDQATKNIALMRLWGLDMNGTRFPSLPDELWIDYTYDISIPGDFVQRASTARMLNPNYKLSSTTLDNVLFPEVQNSLAERARVKTEEATDNPIWAEISLIRNMLKAADEAREFKDEGYAQLLDSAAAKLEQSLGEGSPGESPALAPGIPPEALPPEVQEVLNP